MKIAPALLLFYLLGFQQSQAVESSHLERFYILAHVVSDAAPFQREYLLDVRIEQNKSVVRIVRVAAPHPVCEGIIVKAAEKAVDLSPQQLLGRVQLCSMNTRRIDKIIRTARYKTWAQFDTVGYDIVATCGNAERTINLPLAESVDMEKIKRSNPEVADLWHVFSKTQDIVFGNDFDWNGAQPGLNAQFRALGDSLVPMLRSGVYGSSLAELMRKYRKGLSETLRAPELVDSDASQFTKYVQPRYPRLASAARVEGTVRLELTVDKESGKIKSVRVLSGHPLLDDSAVDAARQWEFVPKLSKLDSPFELAIRYRISCAE
jgi:TonB family protein